MIDELETAKKKKKGVPVEEDLRILSKTRRVVVANCGSVAETLEQRCHFEYLFRHQTRRKTRRLVHGGQVL